LQKEAIVEQCQARMAGVDVARFLAIVSMFAAHVGPTDRFGPLGRAFHLMDGLAPILFVLVAGMGVSLLFQSRTASVSQARVRLIWTGFVLLFAGLWLQELDHGIRVILQHFTPLFLLGAGLVTLHKHLLLWLGAVLMIIGPVTFLYGLMYFPSLFDREVISVLTSPAEVLHRLLATGSYPMITYAGVFLLGMSLAKFDLARKVVAERMLLHGFAAFLGVFLLVMVLESFGIYASGRPEWNWLTLTRSHSQMPLWVISTTGFAVALVGLCLLVVPRLEYWFRPVVIAGQMALTLYVAQLVVFHFWPEAVRSRDLLVPAVWKTLGLSLGAVAFAVAWRVRFSKGPLEALLQLPWMLRWR